MKVKDLNEQQIKQLYCAAMGWHSQLNVPEGEESSEKFDEFCEQIEFEWDVDRWTISGKLGQIEITEDLYFRCGMNTMHFGLGGTAFDLKAVFKCLIEFEIEGIV
ncbi:hypothetical protein J2810_004611 [Chryseobacterium rhizosphaerae]|uniref:hypothetical protein n=1 Tax=Chryseobacterium rhizosphaerae TaxID=395937 RepID=UPI002859557F|nr:hypothetical protein [Chryseobacterium rhizosphaerae]MDR6548521.1 hypothetical protein [Chryseobacterium rhizosphaerae]